jgi:cytochrome c peroxidase
MARDLLKKETILAAWAGMALGVATVVGGMPAAAQAPASTPLPAQAPPTPTPLTFAPVVAAKLPAHPPPPDTVTADQEKTALPPGTPAFFRKIYHSVLTAPLPNQIFEQGGVPSVIPEYEVDVDPTGRLGSYQPLGPTITATNAFFQPLGTNGRTCVTCHLPPNAMSVSLDNINARWNATAGADPIFAPIDGADCPNKVPLARTSGSLVEANVGAGNARDPRDAHSLLLKHGLFRIFLPVPEGAEFTIDVINDPTNDSTNPARPNGCNTDPKFREGKDSQGNPAKIISIYRRPRIASNLPYVTTTRSDLGVNPPIPNDPVTNTPVSVDKVSIDPRTGRPISGNIMWDGREPTLETQATDATLGHAQAVVAPNATQVAQMVQFELGIFSAQLWDAWAHALTAEGGFGGPTYLSGGTPGLPAQTLPVTAPPTPPPPPPPLPTTTTASFPLFDNWATLAAAVDRAAQRESVARGERIFETRLFVINGVAGFNDILAGGTLRGPVTGTCSSCHNQANTGNDSFVAAQHDIGIGGTSPPAGTAPPSGSPSALPTCNPQPPTQQPNGCFPSPASDLPIFKITCTSGKSTSFEGPVVVTNDPGLALITGRCADIGRFTVPQLRGLAARAPYFSDGSAATLLDVVDFYTNRFNIGLSSQDEDDLANFLRSL